MNLRSVVSMGNDDSPPEVNKYFNDVNSSESITVIDDSYDEEKTNMFASTSMWSSKWKFLDYSEISRGFGVASNLVAEIVSNSLLAGLNPVDAINSTWIMCCLTSIIHGGPMISGTTGAVAFIISTLVIEHGSEYVFYTVILAGALQTIFGAFRLGSAFKLVSSPVCIGFLTSVGILISISQLRYFKVDPLSGSTNSTNIIYNFPPTDEKPWIDVTTITIMMFELVGSFLTCFLVPYFTKKVSNVLVAIWLMTAFEWGCIRPLGYATPTISELSGMDEAIPLSSLIKSFEDLPSFNFDTIEKIYKHVLLLFFNCLVESNLTTIYTEELTRSNMKRNLVATGQGIGQIVSALAGGIGGSALTTQTAINIKSGSNSGLSCFTAGLFVFCFAVLCPGFQIIPISATSGVMLYGAFHLIEWKIFSWILYAFLPETVRKKLNLTYKVRRYDVFIMVIVIILSLFQGLAIAVLSGTILQFADFAYTSSNTLKIQREFEDDAVNAVYHISGPIFFGTAEELRDAFTEEKLKNDPHAIILSFEGANTFDYSGLLSLYKIQRNVKEMEKIVVFAGINLECKRKMAKMSTLWEDTNFLEYQEFQQSNISEAENEVDKQINF